jgi:hypothetical protein
MNISVSIQRECRVLYLLATALFALISIGCSSNIQTEGVVISMERTACYGTCPVYTLTIKGDGTVIYEGKDFVKVTGKQDSKISDDKVKKLIQEFYDIDYFSLEDSYTYRVNDDGSKTVVQDLPTTKTSITIEGKTKSVDNYYGAPEKLKKLEDKIDEMCNSKVWVKGS